MEQLITSDFKLGIISGGQLGKILALSASNWDVQTYILDPSLNCPASQVCTNLTQGSPLCYDTVIEFGLKVDMIALEIENVNVEALLELKKRGKRIFPDPEILRVIQDKGLQKEFYRTEKIPTSPFKIYESENDILEALKKGEVALPFVQKVRTAGYDGKGVKLVRNDEQLLELLEGPSVIEELTNIKKELAVIVARNTKGETSCFPTVEMVFNEDVNLVEQLICPANISKEIEEKAEQLSLTIAEKLSFEGILAVELFLTHDDELLVNEVAPRPHNSGHHTVEGTITSQYEQYLRAIFGFPLGDTSIKLPSVMINLLGEPNHFGKVKYEGITESMALSGVKTHSYGKKETYPFRKMGHVTVMDKDLNKAIFKAEKVKQLLKVKAWKNLK
jgi:5-(carboxyamino)imidazole ribonucleotide synthase